VEKDWRQIYNSTHSLRADHGFGVSPGRVCPKKVLENWNGWLGGTFYYVGSGIANVVTKYVKEVKLTPEATGGGTENLRRIYQGNMELALITPSDLDIVRKDGTAKPDRISILGAAHKSITHLVIRKDTGYKTAKDFYHKGVKVGIGEPGSAV
jgi:hypothetical protein